MKKWYVFQVVLLFSSFLVQAQNNTNKLWYKFPAKAWIEALPIGNGRLGAMVFGNPVHERIQLNEESIWAGSKINNNNTEALRHLKELQQALFNNQYSDAFKIAEKNFVGTPPEIRSYQPLGDLWINYLWNEAPNNYRRQLDLETGIATTNFQVANKKYSQKVWISAPDNLIVVRIESKNGGLINSSFSLKREKDAVIQVLPSGIIKLKGQIVDVDDSMSGKGGDHMKFSAELRLKCDNGIISATDTSLIVSNAKNVTVVLTAATDYNIEKLNFDRIIDSENTCKVILDKAEIYSTTTLEKRHLKEYQAIFSRVELSLGTDSLNNLPTNERLRLIKNGGADNGLMALYFQYGRYLLISSSRKPGVLPANLQGIWNKDYKAAWNSDFHTNINLQMNYWLAENCNLPETTEPLSNFMTKTDGAGSYYCKRDVWHQRLDSSSSY